jgi:hypothetical protein
MTTNYLRFLAIVSVAVNIVLAFVIARLYWPDAVGTEYGSFVNSPPKAELDGNGRDITLLEDFAYKDRRNTVWIAPKGYVSNGASIPSFLWSVVGAPLDGKYRNAAIVHDAACDAMEKPPADVHLAFYEACRCGGLSEAYAKILYTGVLLGGPRWSLVPREDSVPQTVTKYVSEERTKEVIDPATGEKKTVAYTVQVPVTEQLTQAVVRMVPERRPSPPVTPDDVSDIVQLIGSGTTSLEDLQRWAESRGAAAEDRDKRDKR